MGRLKQAAALLLGLVMAACSHAAEHAGNKTRFAAVECAPFARALTGVALTGAAADWWRQAAGRYDQSQRPMLGSLLVFRRSARLPSGHVAVVSRVIDRRTILVTQANWVRHQVSQDQPVIDISSAGDWSLVKVWWSPSRQVGVTPYPTFGFIRPERLSTHDQIIENTPSAIRLAEEAR